jgi:hypothetical protein
MSSKPFSPVKHELVTDERAAKLADFAADFAALCNRYQLDVYASPDADMIEIAERGFPYPTGYGYSATMTGVVDGKLETFAIDREWTED